MEWEEFHDRLTRLKSVSARSDHGQSIVEELSNVGLNARPGRLPDMEETKVCRFLYSRDLQGVY